jgi:hypothetical protein
MEEKIVIQGKKMRSSQEFKPEIIWIGHTDLTHPIKLFGEFSSVQCQSWE